MRIVAIGFEDKDIAFFQEQAEGASGEQFQDSGAIVLRGAVRRDKKHGQHADLDNCIKPGGIVPESVEGGQGLVLRKRAICDTDFFESRAGIHFLK